MHSRTLAAAAVLLFTVGFALPTAAQTTQTLRVIYGSVVMAEPRGDSIVLGSVATGTVVEVLRRQDNWFLVRMPADTAGDASWERGWIHASMLEGSVGSVRTQAAAAGNSRRGSLMIRGFAHTGGTIFTAGDTFDTILGRTFGLLTGGGGQVVFPNGVFAQASVERFRKTGSRALVSGTQIFILDVPDTVTLTPLHFTAGYRAMRSGVIPFLGAGVGSYSFEEEAPSPTGAERVSERHIGYHVLGGAELPVLRWLWIAGEIQWTAVPKALGDTGVSAVFEEDDLGGTALRFKVIIGR